MQLVLVLDEAVESPSAQQESATPQRGWLSVVAVDQVRPRLFIWDDRRGELELAAIAINKNFRGGSEDTTGHHRLGNQRAPP
jgi:hypothetical protein